MGNNISYDDYGFHLFHFDRCGNIFDKRRVLFLHFWLGFMLSKLEASRSTVFVYLSTVVSLLAGVVFRGERFGPLQVIGISLILLGVWGANALARRKTREESK